MVSVLSLCLNVPYCIIIVCTCATCLPSHLRATEGVLPEHQQGTANGAAGGGGW